MFAVWKAKPTSVGPIPWELDSKYPDNMRGHADAVNRKNQIAFKGLMSKITEVDN